MKDEQFQSLIKKLDALLVSNLIENPNREDKKRILKNAGFREKDIIELIGPAPSTVRVRKLRARRKR